MSNKDDVLDAEWAKHSAEPWAKKFDSLIDVYMSGYREPALIPAIESTVVVGGWKSNQPATRSRR